MGIVRDFKVGVWIGHHAYKPNNCKVGQKGRGLRYVTYFYNFCTPTTSTEQLNIQTSNLEHRLTTRGTILELVNSWCVKNNQSKHRLDADSEARHIRNADEEKMLNTSPTQELQVRWQSYVPLALNQVRFKV